MKDVVEITRAGLIQMAEDFCSVNETKEVYQDLVTIPGKKYGIPSSEIAAELSALLSDAERKLQNDRRRAEVIQAAIRDLPKSEIQ